MLTMIMSLVDALTGRRPRSSMKKKFSPGNQKRDNFRYTQKELEANLPK